WIDQGVTFIRDRVAPENLGSLLGRFLSPGALLIDLAWNIDCCEIVQWCHDHGVLYINTSVEVWDPDAGAANKPRSERDTKITDQPKEVHEFVNTWSVEGFREEGTTTAELGWGTHEKELPNLAYEHSEGPKAQIALARMGINTYVASWVPPDHNIIGMIVRHGEAFTITNKLSVCEDGK